jgi:1-acyl-sn-glycerol-3-phosphate acyltransferase
MFTPFRVVWAIYGVILFLLMMLVSLPILGINMAFWSGKKALRKNIWYLHHPFTKVFFTLIGVRIRVHGLEHINPAHSYVMVGNHRSSLDFVANGYAFPGIFRFLAKEELQKIPIFGWVVKKMCLTVDRKSAISRARSVVALKKELEEGVSIFIYPEGSRNRTGEPLAEFYDGAFRIALQTGAPILPVTIANMSKISSAAVAIDLAPGFLDIYFDPPIATTDLSADNIGALKEHTKKIMAQHLL